MQMIKLSVIALAVAAASTQLAVASQQSESKGFIEDSKLDAHARVLYMNRDFRNDTGTTTRNSYNEDAGLGLKAIYESGFTQGTVGFGVDAFGLQGIKLDSGRGRNGNGQFPNERNGKAKDNYSQAGGAVKARLSNTTLKYGEQFVDLPVLSTDDSRLLPQTTTGFLVTSNEIENLELNLGHFTAMTAQNAVRHDGAVNDVNNNDSPVSLRSLDLVGGRYNFTDDLSAAYFYADAKVGQTGNRFQAKKHYTNVNYTLPIADAQNLNFDFNMYNTKFNRKDNARGDRSSTNNVWSLATAYTLDAHTFTVGHQRVTGGNDQGYQYDYDGGGSVYLLNDVQYNDFRAKGEKSFQARYDIDMASFGVPGLSFMTRYVRGTNIDNGTRNDGKNWERDTEAKYVLQSGAAKDLAFRLRQATYRANGAAHDATGNTDVNEVRLIVEYPLSIL